MKSMERMSPICRQTLNQRHTAHLRVTPCDSIGMAARTRYDQHVPRNLSRSTLASLLVLLGGCFRLEPLSDDGPPVVLAKLETRDSPRLVERFRSTGAPALIAVEQCLVQDDQLYVLVSEKTEDTDRPSVFVFGIVDGDLRLKRCIQPVDQAPSEIVLLPGNPPFLAKADKWAQPVSPTSREFQFFNLTPRYPGIRAAGRFAAMKEIWPMMGEVNGTTVQLLEWTGDHFKTLETNDYNQWSVEYEIAADGEFAALLINSDSGFQLLRHDPDTGEELMRLDDRKTYGRIMSVSVRGSESLSAWTTSSGGLAISDAMSSLQFSFDDVIMDIGCLLAPRGSFVVVHFSSGKRSVMRKQADGRWTIGPPEECRAFRPKFVIFRGRAWQLDVLRGALCVDEIVD